MKTVLLYLGFCLSVVLPSKGSGQPLYTGDSLRAIEFPIGGIGTGNILLDGRGSIRHLEIFNAANRRELPPEMTFFCLWMQQQGGEPEVRILERELFAPFFNPFGQPRQQLIGLPRFPEAEFLGQYPFANVRLIDHRLPLEVELCAYNPFIPLDPDDSGIPAAVFNWSVKNTGAGPLAVSIAFNMSNPIKVRSDGAPASGSNLNEMVPDPLFRGVKMTSSRAHPDSIDYAELAVLTTEHNVEIQTRWYRGGWFDNAHLFWDDFRIDGRLPPIHDAVPSPRNRTDVASVLVHFELDPGEKRTIPFYLCWYVPNRHSSDDYALGQPESKKNVYRNYYAVRYRGVMDVAADLIRRIESLHSRTKRYHDVLFQSTWPDYVLDAVSANAAGLKTNLLMRVENGDVHGFEGLGNDFGCCAGTCTHVWNYAQTMASLFPSLARNVRSIAFVHDTFANGFQAHRSVFPLGPYWFDGPPAADGQMGNIVRVYREWKNCGDREFLLRLWPKVKAALEFAWKGPGKVEPDLAWQLNSMKSPWDPDRDGLMEGRQHNTYDIDFYGPNSMMGSLYLAALKAAAEMAEAAGEPGTAAEYRRIYQSGVTEMERRLWNGEYYVQNIEIAEGLQIPARLKSPPDRDGVVRPKYQYGGGCLSDQLLGQYLAYVAGLGALLDSSRIRSALSSVYRYNYIPLLRDFHNVQRVYGLNDEGGLIACTWPRGGRPALPFVYADELWTGIEYQAAASMIYSGLVQQGLHIVETVRRRYAGHNRNPYAEIESGRFYARAMASWSVLLALSGFFYDGVENSMVFEPKFEYAHAGGDTVSAAVKGTGPFSTFWSCGTAWGALRIGDSEAVLSIAEGALRLQTLELGTAMKSRRVVRCSVDGKNLNFDLLPGSALNIRFYPELTLQGEQTLGVRFAAKSEQR